MTGAHSAVYAPGSSPQDARDSFGSSRLALSGGLATLATGAVFADWTIECWVLWTNFGGGDFVKLGTNSEGHFRWAAGGTVDHIFIVNGVTMATLTTQNGYPGTSPWVHVVGTREGSTAKFYYDGVLSGTRTVTAGATDAGQVSIGNQTSLGAPPTPQSTYLDDVAVYTRALTAQEIEQHYLAE